MKRERVSWGLGLIICGVGSDSGRITSVSGQKNVGPCPAHDMIGSGRIRVGSGWPTILCVIFGLDQVFLSFRSNIWPVPDPSLGRIGSGRVFFRAGWIGFIGSGGPWSGPLRTVPYAGVQFFTGAPLAPEAYGVFSWWKGFFWHCSTFRCYLTNNVQL